MANQLPNRCNAVQGVHLLQEVIESVGDFHPRRYSGRGMYGESCLGVELDSSRQLGKFIAGVIDHLGGNGCDEEEHAEIAQAFDRMTTDQMGLGIVAYFPGVHFFDREAGGNEGGGL